MYTFNIFFPISKSTNIWYISKILEDHEYMNSTNIIFFYSKNCLIHEKSINKLENKTKLNGFTTKEQPSSVKKVSIITVVIL